MNEEDKRILEQAKTDNAPGSKRLSMTLAGASTVAWLIKKMEEAQAEVAKVEGQRDRLAEVLRRAQIHLTHTPQDLPSLAHETYEALAELKKEIQ